MPEPIAYEAISKELARLVPEAATYIQEQIDFMEEDLPHVTCGNFAVGWLYQGAARGEVTDGLMARLAKVLARMCVSSEAVQEVLYLSVLPIMVTHPVIAPLLAKHTDACLDEGIRGMGFKKNDDGSPFVWPPVARESGSEGSS